MLTTIYLLTTIAQPLIFSSVLSHFLIMGRSNIFQQQLIALECCKRSDKFTLNRCTIANHSPTNIGVSLSPLVETILSCRNREGGYLNEGLLSATCKTFPGTESVTHTILVAIMHAVRHVHGNPVE